MRLVWGSLLVLLILTTPAAARMYQWQSPASGRVQLAGSAPPWYRGTTAGPRVLVFDNGELVDDTAIAVPEERRRSLREEALGAAVPAAAMPATSAENVMPAAVPEGDVVPDTLTENLDAAPADSVPAREVNETTHDSLKASRLKALIDAWDTQQLEQARSLLELVPGSGTPPPAPAGRPATPD